jgi:subtilase family serine protease
LIDLSGKSVRKLVGSASELTVNVSDLVQGIYTVIVRTENGTSTSRVIVE